MHTEVSLLIRSIYYESDLDKPLASPDPIIKCAAMIISHINSVKRSGLTPGAVNEIMIGMEIGLDRV